MAIDKTNDIINKYFTDVINQMLSKLGLEEIQPNELKDLGLYSIYQGTNKPETVLYISCNNKMISFNFKKGKLTSSNWRYF